MSDAGELRPGALALVLHSHMPYVEGFGTWPFGEEWLWEAVACVYLPLLDLLDGAPVTIGMTPVLCDQLEAMRGEPGERYMRFLREIRAPIHDEDAARAGGAAASTELAAEVRRAAGDYTRAERAFEERERDLMAAFRSLEQVELWTSAATHALLPLVATDAGLRLQLATGTASHMRRFGHWSGGFWLPECAYVPGLERELADEGVQAFCVDQTQVEGFDHLLPVATEPGPVAVPIDWETIQLVWNDENGYPAHPLYRNYHGRTVHDLRPWSNAGEPYDHDAALALAREHARDFVTAGGGPAPAGRPALLRARHGAARTLVVRGTGLARRGGGGGSGAGRATGDGVGGDRARGAGGTRARALDLGARQGLHHLGRAGGGRACLRGARRRAAHRGRRGGARDAARGARARRPRAARACSRATGPSWSRATWPRTTPPSG